MASFAEYANIKKGINQEKRQRSQNYKKYGNRETGLRETNLVRERREYHERDKNFRLYGREALDSEL